MSSKTKQIDGKGLAFDKRQKKLLSILMIGIFFEGFDDALINIALPYITTDFGLSDQQAGFSLSIVGLGTMFAFFFVRLADSKGRRPVFLLSVVAYTICSFITAFSPSIQFLIFWQFIARIFLISAWSLGYVIVSEEFESQSRGKVSSIRQSSAVAATLILSMLLPVFSMLGWNWRAMYIVGALPLIPVIIFHKWLPETEQFLQVKKEGRKAKQNKDEFFAVWQKKYRKKLIAMAIIWVFLYFGLKGSVNFFSLHVVNDLGWTSGMLSAALIIQTLVGVAIMGFNGRLLDKIGRKKGAMFIIVMGALTASTLFIVNQYVIVIIMGCLAMGFTNSFLIVASTITNELFPTEVRANAMAWANNIIGRMGQVIVPSVVGLLSVYLGLRYAVVVVVLLPLIAAALIWFYIPETKIEGKLSSAVNK